MGWWAVAAVMAVAVGAHAMALITRGRLRRPLVIQRVGLALAGILGEAVVASAIPSARSWRYPLLVGQAELASLVVACVVVAVHPSRLIWPARLGWTKRAMLARTTHGRAMRMARPLLRPAPAFVALGAAIVSWQVAVPWVAASGSVWAREAFVVANFALALPFWAQVYPSGTKARLSPAMRAAYVGAAAMVANIANIVQLSGLPVVVPANQGRVAALLGPRLATAMFLTGASGYLAIILMMLVLEWLRGEHERQDRPPPRALPLPKRSRESGSGSGKVIPLQPRRPVEQPKRKKVL